MNISHVAQESDTSCECLRRGQVEQLTQFNDTLDPIYVLLCLGVRMVSKLQM